VLKSGKAVLLISLCLLILGSGVVEAAIHHTVQRGETVWRISQQYGSTVAAVGKANNLSNTSLIHVGQVLIIPGKHRVAAGETLWRISQKYGSTVAAIAGASGISNAALIYPGQILTIPGEGSTSIPTASQPSQPGPGTSLSSADMDLFARLVYSESNGEPYVGQVAVAASVLNRVKDPRFPGNVRSVILQVVNGYYQYSPVLDGRINLPANQAAYNAVRDALNGWDPSLGATGFYNPRKTTNQWVRNQPVTTVIGNHVFFR
jgi:N-acetylmuramoyl-L-alanine amidase